MESADGTVTVEWHADVRCAFDVAAGFLRFDYISPDDPKQGYFLIERPDEVILHGAHSPTLEILPLSTLPKQRPDRFFDARVLGLASPTEMRGKRFEDVLPLLNKPASLRGRPADTEGMNWLIMTLGRTGTERHTLVNEQQGRLQRISRNAIWIA